MNSVFFLYKDFNYYKKKAQAYYHREIIKLLNDNEVYHGNHLECLFNDENTKKYFGILANMNFMLVCEYGENGDNPEIIVYKKR